jgi:hypothetical protein
MKKDNTTVENSPNCPALEQLSGFFDSAIELPAEVTEHINNCPVCMNKLSQFRILELALKQHLNTNIPENLVADIKAGVHEKLEKTVKSPHPFPGIFLKIAAAFAIVSFAIFYSADFFRPVAVQQPVPNAYHVRTTPVVSHKNDRYPPYYNGEYPGIMPGIITENSIPLHNIVGANYGGSREPVFQVENLSASKNAPASIASSVHQVWISTNPEQAADTLNSILKRLNVTSAAMTEANDEFSGSVKLTKMQLVKLIRSCKQAGLDLLSSQAPQPEQNKFRGRPDTQVEYNFNIISPGK